MEWSLPNGNSDKLACDFVRYIHDYSNRTGYLYLWTPNCTHSIQGVLYNPTDPQWQGADGGFGVLSEPTPSCNFNFPPCNGGFDFPLKYGKSFGIADGAANTQMGLGIINVAAASVGNIFNFGANGLSWK